MGKRSNFDRKDKDFYVTPINAVVPLVPHLFGDRSYVDPCYGEGAIENILDILVPSMICSDKYDLYPEEYNTARTGFVKKEDAQIHLYTNNADYFITNPPWSRDKKSGYLLHKIIDNLAGQKPTWLLLDADWMHTKQAAPYLKYCVKIVSVGRVSWMENGVSGKDNCAWYLFDKNHTGSTEFIGR